MKEDIVIKPTELSGEIKVPASKSICHRAMICAGLSNGVSCISNVTFSEDLEATCKAMKSLGAVIIKEGNFINVKNDGKVKVRCKNIDCLESGSTLRFLVPVVSTTGEKVTFEGNGRLIERPLDCYYKIFDEQGFQYKNAGGKLPLTVEGKLKPGEYRIRGDVSSQFISGLMFALPLLNGNSQIIVTTKLESKPYIDLTIDMLKKFSVEIENKDYEKFNIKGNQTYKPCDYEAEGDFSQAAFWLTAGLLGKEVTCSGLNINSVQGDKAILSILKSMGGKIFVEGNKVRAMPSKTTGKIIDASQCPDLVPILASLAALSEGTTKIINAVRLRLKESDRLMAISTELNKIGAEVKEIEDGLIINGKPNLIGGKVESWNDHRIVMALAIASIKCAKPVIIKGASCVKKSYPDFWKHFISLGGDVNEWNMGE